MPNSLDATRLLSAQHVYFASGVTRSEAFRLSMLRRLRTALCAMEEEFLSALFADLHKSRMESYMTELGIVLDELRFHETHLHRWMREQSVPTPLTLMPARSIRSPEPYGSVLIISPWNYPVQLCLSPLIGAISAGNCAVIKPSEYAPATSHVIAKLIARTFPPSYITVVEGAVPETTALLHVPFDFIFFTGSPMVGKIVMRAAAEHLTPTALELGGKSPVIIDQSANLKVAAQRILYGKYLNAGQICVAPDYALVEASVQTNFLRELRSAMWRFSPDGSFSQMAHIVNEQHYARLSRLLEGQHIILGGRRNAAHCFLSPTVLVDVALDAPVMQEEIFGPILPVIPYHNLEAAIAQIQSCPKPLALYVFSQDKAVIRHVLGTCSFGGGCVNDVVLHVASHHLPFGGVGNAGMGQYHGKSSYQLFTHTRSILKASANFDLPLRYPPESKWKDRLVRLVL